MHRDLKPENIGFDIRGDIKVFDFGLTRELPPESMMMDENGNEPVYHRTFAGSLRYMAPEVATGQPYNLKVDVYSFSIIWWQVMALRKPFELYAHESLLEHYVHRRGERPVLKRRSESMSPTICHLLQRGWEGNIQKRADIRVLKRGICSELMRLREGDVCDLDSHDVRYVKGQESVEFSKTAVQTVATTTATPRRRSTFIFHSNRSLLPTSAALNATRAAAAAASSSNGSSPNIKNTKLNNDGSSILPNTLSSRSVGH
jgi:serine/threonine protein kinase